jgi:GT2 family glycosyltransferase
MTSNPKTSIKKSVDCSVIIVNWNTGADLLNCLASLFLHVSDGISWEAIVVDNASTDNSVQAIQCHFPSVKVLQNQSNLGFSAANNIGIEHASGRYILLLNPDTIVTEDCLSPLLHKMDSDPTIGVVGCRLKNEDGTYQHSADLFPFPLQEINPLFRRLRRKTLININAAVEAGGDCEVGTVIGAFQMIRREQLDQIGLLNESLFIYGEDLDLCYRIQKAGKRIVYDASVSIIHLGARSSDQVWSESARLCRVRESILRIHNEHFGPIAAVASLFVRTILSWLRIIASYMRPVPAHIRGLYVAEAISNNRTIAKMPSILGHRKTK